MSEQEGLLHLLPYMPTIITFPIIVAIFRAIASACKLTPFSLAAVAPREAEFAPTVSIAIAVTATALSIAVGAIIAASNVRMRRVFLLIVGIHTSILTYTGAHAAGYDIHYAAFDGRPVSLLRSVSWMHSLGLFATVLLQLSSWSPWQRAYYIFEVELAVLLVLGSFFAPMPWRHLSFALCQVFCFRWCYWVRELLLHVVSELRGKLRHPYILWLFTAYVYFCILLESTYCNVIIMGMFMHRISVVAEWRMLLGLDIIAKVLNPLIVATLLEATAIDVRQHGLFQRWQVLSYMALGERVLRFACNSVCVRCNITPMLFGQRQVSFGRKAYAHRLVDWPCPALDVCRLLSYT
jgi:hypothetical protein